MISVTIKLSKWLVFQDRPVTITIMVFSFYLFTLSSPAVIWKKKTKLPKILKKYSMMQYKIFLKYILQDKGYPKSMNH